MYKCYINKCYSITKVELLNDNVFLFQIENDKNRKLKELSHSSMTI